MPPYVPAFDPLQIASTADALNSLLPCPYPRRALLDWVEGYWVVWDRTRYIRPKMSAEQACSMLHAQYREWVEMFDEYRL